MKLQSVVKSGRMGAVICGIILSTGLVRADEWDKKTIMTVSEQIQNYNTYLEPGTYVLRLLSSESDRHIVQIFNRDETHIINTVLAIPNYRLQPTGKSQFLFWETPPGTARAMRAWFYPGDNFGQEFLYPGTLKYLSARATTPAPPPAPAPEPAPAIAMTTPAPEPQQPVVEEQETIIAQNTAPAPEAQPAPEEQPAPPALPHTASAYPLIGLTGLLSMMAYGWLKMKRTA